MSAQDDGGRGGMRQGRMSRKMAVGITVLCGVVTAGLCLGVNALFGSPIQWFWLVVAPLYVSALIGLFLWVRLTPSA